MNNDAGSRNDVDDANGDEEQITRRQWLTRQAILRGADAFMAREAVSSVAIEHPEWDMDLTKTMHEWETSS